MFRYKTIFFLITVLLILFPFPAMGEYIVAFEYYLTTDPAAIKNIKVLEDVNRQKKQILMDDTEYADENSQRTLTALMDIFKWYQVVQYHNAFSPASRVFSEEIIVKENEATYQGFEVPGGYLTVSLDVRSKRNHSIPVGIKILFNNMSIFSGAVRSYPLDQLILLHESFDEVDDDEELEMLFLKLTRCPPELCDDESQDVPGEDKPVNSSAPAVPDTNSTRNAAPGF